MEATASLKDRLQQMKNDIDDAEARESTCKSQQKEVQARLDGLNIEIDSLKRKILLASNQLDQKLNQVKGTDSKLSSLVSRSTICEEEVKKLELREQEGDESLSRVEEALKIAKQVKEEADARCREAQWKFNGLERDTAKSKDKADAAEAKLAKLEVYIREAAESLRHLEKKEDDASLREEESTRIIKALELQIKEAEASAEAAERLICVHERNVSELEDDIRNYKKKTEEVQKQLDEIDLADY